LLRLASLIPLPVLYGLMAGVSLLVRLSGWRRGLVREYIDRCLPGLDERRRRGVERGFYRYLGELVAEITHGMRIDREALLRRVRFENEELLRAPLAEGRRVMILAAHHCNWEWLLLACSARIGVPLTAAYKPASVAHADEQLRAMRGRFGAQLVRARDLVSRLLEQRGGVRLLALLADQSPAAGADQQTWLPYFGQETSFHSGPGWIGARMGFVPVFAAMRRERRGHYVVRLIPLTEEAGRPDPAQILRAYVGALEEQVRAYPEEYFWAYRRWKREKPLYA
jgi:KDO2-lipid IV(A) lauroyltransferase